MEELISSGLAGIDVSIFRGGEGKAEAEAEGDASATTKQRGGKTKDGRRENHEYINIAPPPCPQPPPPLPETTEQEEEEEEELGEVLRDEDRITGYRGLWESRFAGKYGSFGDETSLGPMRFTFGPIPCYASPHCTMQIYGIRVADLEDGLRWPLHVHGIVAARDTSDHNRNFLFNRTTDNCQILTQQDPYLLLTGPSRAIVIIDPITIEFQLKVKSKTNPKEDELLALGIFNYPQTYLATSVRRSGILCNRCTIEIAYAPLDPSVEATIIGVRVVDRAWPEGLRGRVVAGVTTVREGEVLLLDSLGSKMPISPSTGAVELSRRVVSVDLKGGKLVVSVVATSQTGGKEDDDDDDDDDGAVVVARGDAAFAPKRAGTSDGTCDLGFCKVEVTVARSLVPSLLNEWDAVVKLAEERP